MAESEEELKSLLKVNEKSEKIGLSLPLYNHKGFDLGHTWMV